MGLHIIWQVICPNSPCCVSALPTLHIARAHGCSPSMFQVNQPPPSSARQTRKLQTSTASEPDKGSSRPKKKKKKKRLHKRPAGRGRARRTQSPRSVKLTRPSPTSLHSIKHTFTGPEDCYNNLYTKKSNVGHIPSFRGTEKPRDDSHARDCELA